MISELSAINVQKMSNDDISEAIRPKLVPLLIQRLTKFKETLPLLTLAPELEQLILTSVRQNPDEKMLLLDGALAKNILSNINTKLIHVFLYFYYTKKNKRNSMCN